MLWPSYQAPKPRISRRRPSRVLAFRASNSSSMSTIPLVFSTEVGITALSARRGVEAGGRADVYVAARERWSSPGERIKAVVPCRSGPKLESSEIPTCHAKPVLGQVDRLDGPGLGPADPHQVAGHELSRVGEIEAILVCRGPRGQVDDDRDDQQQGRRAPGQRQGERRRPGRRCGRRPPSYRRRRLGIVSQRGQGLRRRESPP